MEWLLGLVCGLICFGFLTEAQPRISVQHRIIAALPGEKLSLMFHVIVPVNQSSDKFVCRHAIHKRDLDTSDISETTNISWELSVFNSSDSGEYYCEYKNTKAYWVVLVGEYWDPSILYAWDDSEHAILNLNVALNVGLFIFSLIGSIFLLNDYRKERKLRDEKNEEGEEETGNEVGDEVATDSVYTALEHGTSSIYRSLDPSANDKDKKCVQQVMNEPCMNHDSQKEDESLYENF